MEKKIFKEVYRNMVVLLALLTIMDIIILLISGNRYIKYMLYTVLIIDIVVLIIAPVFIRILSKHIQRVKKKEFEVASEDYYREIEAEYTPAMASYIIDNIVETKEAILATILDLSIKGFLEIQKEDTNEVVVKSNSIKSLYSHEQYIINCIKNNEKVNHIEFEKRIVMDCYKKNLIIENKEKRMFVVLLLISLAVIEVFTILGIIGCILYFLLNTFIRKYVHTDEGKEFALHVKQLKNFIKDYTLLKERDIEDIALFDRYIPYAIALGEADNIENKYIKYKDWQDKYIE